MKLMRMPGAFAAATLLAFNAFGQIPPPADGRPPVEGRPARPLPHRGEPGRADPEAAITGRIARWLVNANGDVDGLLLEDGTQVGFPPHLSAALIDAVQPGETVEIDGWRGAVGQVFRASVIRGTSSGRMVADTPPDPRFGPPPPPRTAGALTAMNASGRIVTALYTDRGDIDGALLQDGTIVRFPPHIGQSLSSTLQPGAPLYARGYGARSAFGTALEATAIGTSAGDAHELYSAPDSAPVDAPPSPVR